MDHAERGDQGSVEKEGHHTKMVERAEYRTVAASVLGGVRYPHDGRQDSRSFEVSQPLLGGFSQTFFGRESRRFVRSGVRRYQT